MPSLPFKLFDTHAHFFTNDTALYPIDISGAREGEEALRQRLQKEPATAKRLFALWDQSGVAGGAAVQYNTVYKTDNSYAIAVADAHGDRTSAVLILDAATPETPAKLRALAGAHNVTGLRLFGQPDGAGKYPWLDSPAALNTWDMAASCGLHMVLMYAPAVASGAALGRIAALARRYPDTVIALDHCGWADDFAGASTLGPDHLALAPIRNIHFKITQINFDRLKRAGSDAAGFVRRLVDTYGPDRLMWGSDYGNTKAGYPEMVDQAIAAIRLLNEAERAQVLHDNGARLFGRRAA